MAHRGPSPCCVLPSNGNLANSLELRNFCSGCFQRFPCCLFYTLRVWKMSGQRHGNISWCWSLGVPVFVFLVLQNCKKSLACIFSAFFPQQILDSWPGAHTKNLHILLGKKKLLEMKIPHGFTSPLLGILAFLACAVLVALSQLEGKVSL